MSTIAVNSVTDANGGNTTTINTFTPTESNMAGRNRIINGDMRINQRGFSGSPGNGAYMLDRYFYNANAQRITVSQSTDAPAGFTNSMLVTSSAAASIGVNDYTNISQIIEGNNISDLAWGSASAKTITISFWVKSSLTGTFGGALRNTATTGSYYGYPFTYTISAANTWEYKTITIVGPTSTSYFWDTNTNGGIWVWFDFGTGTTYTNTAGSWVQQNIVGASGTTKLVETNGATWRMTGLQFEVGSVATPFERRPYGTELSLCQRYFQRLYGSGFVPLFLAAARGTGSIEARGAVTLPVQMRSSPSLSSSGSFRITDDHSNATTGLSISSSQLSPSSAIVLANGTGNLTWAGTNQAVLVGASNSGEFALLFSSEL